MVVLPFGVMNNNNYYYNIFLEKWKFQLTFNVVYVPKVVLLSLGLSISSCHHGTLVVYIRFHIKFQKIVSIAEATFFFSFFLGGGV